MLIIEEEIRRRLDSDDPMRTGVWPVGMQDLCSILSEQLESLVGSSTRTTEGEELIAPNLLTPFLRERLELGGLRRGWWGMFKVNALPDRTRFGTSLLTEDSKVRFRCSECDWLLTPVESTVLTSPASKVVTASVGQDLHVGFDFPEHQEVIAVEDKLVGLALRLDASDNLDSLTLDRLRVRPWTPVGGGARSFRPAAIETGLPLNPLRSIGPLRHIQEASFGVPMWAFNGLRRTQVNEFGNMFWFTISGEGWTPQIAERIRLRLNCAVYSSRLSVLLSQEGTLWLERDRIRLGLQFCKEMANTKHGIAIVRVRNLRTGREYHAASELDGPGTLSFTVTRSSEDRLIAILEFGYAQKDEIAVSVIYYPLSMAPKDLRAGVECKATVNTREIASAILVTELLDGRGAATADELWSSFRTGLLHGGRCVTRADVAQLLRQISLFSLGDRIDHERVMFEQRAGRFQGLLLPYTILHLPLLNSAGLSDGDLRDAEHILQYQFEQLTPIQCRIRPVLSRNPPGKT
jgi:hypothetical protein